MASPLKKTTTRIAAIAISCSVASMTYVMASPAAAESSTAEEQETLCTFNVTAEQEAATKSYEALRSGIFSAWAQAIKSQLPAEATSFNEVQAEVESLGFNQLDWDFAHGAEIDLAFYPASNAGTYTDQQQLPLDVDHARETLRYGGYSLGHLQFSEKALSLLEYDEETVYDAAEKLYDVYTDESTRAFYDNCHEKTVAAESSSSPFTSISITLGIVVAAIIGIVVTINSGVLALPQF